MGTINHEYLVENGLILFETVIGSQAYGTQTPTSDIDKKFVYILPMDNILGTEYVEQLNVNKDYTGWEIKRFLELLGTSNPTVLELLNSPEDCIITKHPLFDIILKNKEKFITKGCKNSFGGYARQQITKAKGLNKKQNWEKDKVVRKDLLDFCFVIQGEKTIPWKTWNQDKGFEEKFCGLVNVPNARDVYSVYFDKHAYNCFSESIPEDLRNENKKNSDSMGFGYKGLIKVGGVTLNKDNTNMSKDEILRIEKASKENYGESNQLRLSAIPKGEESICNIIYNKDAYTQHCRDFKEYQEWLANRNEQRYVDVKGHGQGIDGKNMMHCMRLIRMAQEIGSGQGIKVRREDAQELLAIRRGEIDLDGLIVMADESIKEMDNIFENSTLPDTVDSELVNNLLIEIRRNFYNL